MRIGIAATAVGCALLLLAGCGPSDPAAAPADSKNGDTDPSAAAVANKAAAAHAVPRGRGSRVPEDFNGDGHRDLVLNDLVKAAQERMGDDAGIGVVYGTKSPGVLDPAVRQLLSPARNAAPTDGTLPAAFDAETACDLDKDGFADLVVTTDPPFNGTGRPPVPLQVLFGGPAGLTGKAVKLRIPEAARYGNEWPDHPVCGDYDGDGSQDLAVTASGGRLSYLRGPFTRAGAPRTAGAARPGVGPVLAAPEPKADVNGDGYDDLVSAARPHAPGTADRGKLLLGGPAGPGRAGGTYTYKAVRPLPTADLPAGGGQATTDLIRYADFDGDKRPDTVVRTHRDEASDRIALHTAKGRGAPLLTFSTAVFG